jgi:hypothetical protein
MWTSLVRQPRGSEAPLHPEQNLTRDQAIRLYTAFEEAHKGSLTDRHTSRRQHCSMIRGRQAGGLSPTCRRSHFE